MIGCTEAEPHTPAIAPTVREQVKAHLAALEAEHAVRVLYACESGSRSWGLASPDSDYEVSFLYVHPLSWYLRVSPGCDVIEVPVGDGLNLRGWELRKALGLLRKGNATLIDWLSSPMVYKTHADFLHALRDAVRQTPQSQRLFQHYVHTARRIYREQLGGERVKLNSYFEALRPLLACRWLEQEHGVVPMRFSELLQATVLDPVLRATIEQLLVRQRAANEMPDLQFLPILNAFIERELTRLESVLPVLPEGVDWSGLDRLLLTTVLQARHSLGE